jgi:hypothetical protein
MTEEQRAMVTADCDLAKGTDASASGTATDNSAPSGSEGTANAVTQDNMMKLCTVIAP